MSAAQGCVRGSLSGGPDRDDVGGVWEGEETLRALLGVDPNDPAAFAALARCLSARMAETRGVTGTDTDVVWSLAEELAGDPRAWFPLVELARLSLAQDREGAVRRLRTAVERDVGGAALTHSLGMLRREGHPRDAVTLAIAHWRPGVHGAEPGRQLVEAAVEDGRVVEVRQYLRALQGLPQGEVAAELCADLDRRSGVRAATDVRDTAAGEASRRIDLVRDEERHVRTAGARPGGGAPVVP